jgi:hypothetical protein
MVPDTINVHSARAPDPMRTGGALASYIVCSCCIRCCIIVTQASTF